MGCAENGMVAGAKGRLPWAGNRIVSFIAINVQAELQQIPSRVLQNAGPGLLVSPEISVDSSRVPRGFPLQH